MSIVNEIYGEIETLRGMLTALMVNWPDLRPRMEPAISKVDAVLSNPSDQTIHFLIEDMLDMNEFFIDVLYMIQDEHLDKNIRQTMSLTNRLLGPEERVGLH